MGTATADPSRAMNAPAKTRRRALRRGGVRTVSVLTVVSSRSAEKVWIRVGGYTVAGPPCRCLAVFGEERRCNTRRRGAQCAAASGRTRLEGADGGELQPPALAGQLVVLGPEVDAPPGVDGRLVVGTGLPHRGVPQLSVPDRGLQQLESPALVPQLVGPGVVVVPGG